MNCANHPDVPVSAYCQNCGKALCTQCVRSVAGVVYCEPCLAARLQAASPRAGAVRPGAGAPGAGWTPVAAAAPGTGPQAGPGTPGAYEPATGVFGAAASPVLAGLLGTIPGVGAMYNGQFIKALVHVVVFIILIGVTQHFDLAGLLIAAWVFYQIFDAIQTAIARRNGLPLPDPFGLNDLGARMGMPGASSIHSPPVAPASSSGTDPAPGFTSGFVADPATGYGPPPASASQAEFDAWAQRAAAEKAMRDAGVPGGGPGYAQAPAAPPVGYAGRPEPVGAIVLIVVGMLFLLSQLGVFRIDWIGRGWPILIIVIGAAMLFRRLRGSSRMGGRL